MKQPKLEMLLALCLLAAGAAHADNNGNITGMTVSNPKPKVGEAVTVTLQGTLAAGKGCHLGGGTVSPFKDLGVITSLPVTLTQTLSFPVAGPNYIHVYPGTLDPDNMCTMTGPGNVKVEVGAAAGNITSVSASTMTPTVGQPVTITLNGQLDAGKKCHVYSGSVSPYKDLGLVSSLPGNVATTFTFDKVGPVYVHVYPGTEDADNLCTRPAPDR